MMNSTSRGTIFWGDVSPTDLLTMDLLLSTFKVLHNMTVLLCWNYSVLYCKRVYFVSLKSGATMRTHIQRQAAVALCTCWQHADGAGRYFVLLFHHRVWNATLSVGTGARRSILCSKVHNLIKIAGFKRHRNKWVYVRQLLNICQIRTVQLIGWKESHWF